MCVLQRHGRALAGSDSQSALPAKGGADDRMVRRKCGRGEIHFLDELAAAGVVPDGVPRDAEAALRENDEVLRVAVRQVGRGPLFESHGLVQLRLQERPRIERGVPLGRVLALPAMLERRQGSITLTAPAESGDEVAHVQSGALRVLAPLRIGVHAHDDGQAAFGPGAGSPSHGVGHRQGGEARGVPVERGEHHPGRPRAEVQRHGEGGQIAVGDGHGRPQCSGHVELLHLRLVRQPGSGDQHDGVLVAHVVDGLRREQHEAAVKQLMRPERLHERAGGFLQENDVCARVTRILGQYSKDAVLLVKHQRTAQL
mmetsp:Transcript_59357/g.181021  ORF Transcript_59357/g.181021 Transcript_59357/m.181021 type:complete len:313 (-) Transcript_59357:765-1703(-)